MAPPQCTHTPPTRTHILTPKHACASMFINPLLVWRGRAAGRERAQSGSFSPCVFLDLLSFVFWAGITCSKKWPACPFLILFASVHQALPPLPAASGWRPLNVGILPGARLYPLELGLGGHRGPLWPSPELAEAPSCSGTCQPSPSPPVRTSGAPALGGAGPLALSRPILHTRARSPRGAGDTQSWLMGTARTWAPAHKSPGHRGEVTGAGAGGLQTQLPQDGSTCTFETPGFLLSPHSRRHTCLLLPLASNSPLTLY